MNLEQNVGGMDKKIRIGAGAVLILLGIVMGFKWWMILIGAVVLATGLFSFCFAYKLLNMNTATPAEQATTSTDPMQRASDNINEVKQDAKDIADTNDDGKINMDDAKHAYDQAADKVKDSLDTNNDGKVDTDDAKHAVSGNNTTDQHK